MTVMVALKTGWYVQPRLTHCIVEPGIIMAGDTHVSLVVSTPHPLIDNPVKIDSISLSNYYIARQTEHESGCLFSILFDLSVR
jgi:hypothetical protein